MKSTKTEKGMKVFFPRDNSFINLPNQKGGTMGGSTTNLAHSLSDDSAQQRVNGKKPGNSYS